MSLSVASSLNWNMCSMTATVMGFSYSSTINLFVISILAVALKYLMYASL
jgi:hypothetical protein